MEIKVSEDMLKFFLLPFSFLYYFIYKIHKSCTRTKTLSVPVVSVGNITWGGTGKTPVTIKLAEEFSLRGKKVAVLSRGYGKKTAESEKCLVVSDGRDILSNVEVSGDEPYMIAEKLKNVAVIVGTNRYESGLYATKMFKPDVFILDDGFQHWGLTRDLDIVCINAVNPFGNGFLIPAGILREPLSALKRAGLIVLTNINGISGQNLLALKKKIASISSAPIISARYLITGIKNVFTEELAEINDSKKIVGFSAIASNENFKTFLKTNNISIWKFYAYRDHYWYKEIKLLKMAKENPDVIFITTRKDAVRFKHFQNLPKEKFFYVDIELKIIEGEEIWQEKIKQFF